MERLASLADSDYISEILGQTIDGIELLKIEKSNSWPEVSSNGSHVDGHFGGESLGKTLMGRGIWDGSQSQIGG